jgi:hypothetical protein
MAVGAAALGAAGHVEVAAVSALVTAGYWKVRPLLCSLILATGLQLFFFLLLSI